MKIILIPIATGFEEIEAVTLIDVLRRAGLKVITASVSKKLDVQGANGIIIVAEKNIQEITSEDIDMVLLPGGWGGTDILSEDKDIGAMCAAPFVLKSAGVLSDNYTCYPSVEEKIEQDGYNPNLKVVEDGNINTSQGPATAICFALHIV